MSLLLESPVDQYRLGCGVYTYAVKSRCGTFHLLEFDATSCEWSRLIDGVSQAKCTVPASRGCCGDLGKVRPWGHELWIYRNGAVVWVGPITNVTWERNSCLIEAQDLMRWAEVREIHKNVDFSGACKAEIATVFAGLCQEGFGYEPICLTIDARPINVMTEITFKAGEHRTLLSQINELSRGLFDWTVYVRRLLGGSALGRFIGRLDDIDFNSVPTLVQRANDCATRVTVLGETNLIVGQVGAVDNFYGLVERTFKLPNLKDSQAAQAAAQRIWDEMHTPPLGVDESWAAELLASSPCRIEDLVPGNTFRIRFDQSCRDVETTMRMQKVDVNVEEAHETVRLTMEASTWGYESEGLLA